MILSMEADVRGAKNRCLMANARAESKPIALSGFKEKW